MKNEWSYSEPEDMDVIAAYLKHLAEEEHCTQYTLYSREKLLRRLDRELPFGIGEVAADDLRAWLTSGRWHHNTQATYFSGMKSFYDWASNPLDPWMNVNPTAGMKGITPIPGVAKPCSDDELERILTESREPYRTWATLAAYNGLRCIEIARLDRKHVTEKRLYVVKGKGDRPRAHDTDPYVWEAVKDLPPGPIARTVHGKQCTANQVSHLSRYYFRTALGIPVTMHQLRHWLGCSVLDATDNLRTTQEILGHARVTSTEIYTRVTSRKQREARAAIPRLAG